MLYRWIIFSFLLISFAGKTYAATYDWVGTSQTGGVYNWNNKLNWQISGVTATTVPGAADIVRIAVNSYTNDPTITDVQTCASIELGVFDNFTLTVNGTLTVSGDITQDNDPNFYQYTVLAGTGTITCNNFFLGNSTGPNSGVGSVINVSSRVNQFNIKGNLTLTAVGNSSGDGIEYPYFSLDANKLSLTGQIIPAKLNNPLLEGVGDPSYPGYGLFQMDNNSSASTLELLNINPIATPIITGFTIDFTNNGTGAGTVIYDAASGTQSVYTTGTTGIGINNYNYDYLTFGGASTKVLTGGALTIGADWTTGGTGTVNLSTYNPTITVTNNWVNSTNVTQGSGNISITNILQNNSNTITLGSGTLNVTNTLQINFGTVSTGSGTVTVTNTFQNNSGTLQCGSGSVIFKGTYSSSGTFTPGTGTIYFSGASQTIVDNSTNGTTFNNVTFNGSGTTTLGAGIGNFAIASKGTLTMVSPAKLVAGTATAAYLTLKSDATGSATIAAITGTSTITGNVNTQRYLTGGNSAYRGYRLMSSPVYAATVGTNKVYSVNFLKNSAYLTGTTGTPGGFDKAGNPTIYLYRENMSPSFSGFTTGNFRGINTISASPNYLIDNDAGTFNIPVGNGFLFFFRGNRSTTLASKTTAPFPVPENTTFTTSGTLNQGQVAVKDWYTPTSATLGYTTATANTAVRGFNLVGNPYASSISWDTFNTTTTTSGIYGTAVSTTMYVYDPVSKNYGAYIKGGGVGTHNTTAILPSGQGFFVQATSAAAKLIFNESAKVGTQVTGTNLLMSARALEQPAAIQYIRLQLAKDSDNTDDIILHFTKNANIAFVQDEDAIYRVGSGLVNLASLSSDNVVLAINNLPLPKTSETVGLKFNASADGIYTLNLKNIVAIPQLFDVTLIDNYTKGSVNMRKDTAYTFNVIKSDSATFGAKRFSILIGQNPSLAYHLLNFWGSNVPYAKQVQLGWKTKNEGNYTNFTVEKSIDGGQTFNVLGSVSASDQGTYSLLDNNPINGKNLYRLKQEDINDSVSYSAIVPVEFSNLSNNLVKGNINVFPNPTSGPINLAITTVNDNAATYNIQIANSSGLVIKQATSSTPAWQSSVSDLLPGTYMLKVINTKDNSLVGNAKFVKL